MRHRGHKKHRRRGSDLPLHHRRHDHRNFQPLVGLAQVGNFVLNVYRTIREWIDRH